ncbi:MAG TPA: cytochrome c [Vicinamibacteria bacterium]
MSNRFAARSPILLALAVPVFLAYAAQAQGQADSTVAGSTIYKTYCAVCHGTEAKGDGPLASSLRFAPPDLTLMAKRNGGVYPSDEVFRIIDGRKPVRGHGGPDMPIWGDAFKQSGEGYTEEKVKQRIDGLVDFLKWLQVKET